MTKVKTTLSLDESLMRQIRVRAARTGRRDSEVMEDVLREGLGSLERIRGRARLSEEEATKLASEVVHEVRRKAPGASPRDSA
jgi:plasmid stability protein